MTALGNGTQEGGSFRDPSGYVHELDGRIIRTVTKHGVAAFEAVQSTGLRERLITDGRLLGMEEIVDPAIHARLGEPERVLEHPRLPYVSHPYEWSFAMLKDAALLHLDIAIEALDAGVALSDASAYNIQFVGPRPVFIDHLSFRPYAEGEYWLGHRQFCEQFLFPLLLHARFGIAHNSWYRGTLEGIPGADFVKLLGARDRLSLNMLSHAILPNRLQTKAAGEGRVKRLDERRGLSRAGYKGILSQLRRWIARLVPRGQDATTWGTYADQNTYTGAEAEEKRRLVAQFAEAVKPELLFDLGANRGDYSVAALEAGAGFAVGFDFDVAAIDKAYARARAEKRNLLPLFLDAANPSPDQGWSQGERRGFGARARADATVALAFEHHLAIGRNVPLGETVRWIVGTAPVGLLEFVEKDDPTVQRMLAMREDVFADYGREAFEAALASHARIEKSFDVTADGRRLYWWDRT
ncbi:MAG: class I SAM-dependent methyltransferase [Pseudomonadota bacterium]